ncbi:MULTISPECIES: hypothetical protein [Vibrio]|jgi:hypothetical protein|uniref:Uncharacterized protein n=1 Tax=Vibrio natriegens NBRC 15636 = ATCC 14048 = DSM 759 TaxID=1219067 RepID=A0AAN0Y698_VIBNA|nr:MULTISPECIES: hypothetical protein [Vibrio]CAH0527474.1 hypothetical protein CTH30272_01117 [Catenococcus thiocycli]ALR18656.1 hypothetical protein PN96_22440 [Vibrio natriegens NBRC 15636 = ATCC 14048 = DSM 759]ANQ14624.1 hypothetical protein BA890_17935 [Vibrio natriegens NBRC 15636 = ATCC 14048 = DSM 759]ANQ19773.1 hypothetical protein BA891_21695 [Vibrio natriegens]ANQ24487.1 hypothetical protein BA893_23100 [Vibrio natriegens]
MNIDDQVIETIEELEAFLHMVESGALGLEGVAGIALAKTNSDGRPFVAVLGDNHQLILGRWVSAHVYENGKDIVQNGPRRTH